MRSGLLSKALLANLIGINLVLLPATAAKIEKKGNAKQIAEVIASGERLRQFPVVVQHSYAIGYTDPLHTLALAFYLDGLDPGKTATPILELPSHRDVREVWIDRDYFLNSAPKLAFYSSSPVDDWRRFLNALPDRALWLVAPAGPVNRTQERNYESVLRETGFSQVRGIPETFDGYPTTRLMLWTRAPTPGAIPDRPQFRGRASR